MNNPLSIVQQQNLLSRQQYKSIISRRYIYGKIKSADRFYYVIEGY